MPSMSFVDGSTIIPATWLNDIDVGVNITLSALLANISNAKNVRLPAIESPGWVTNQRVTSIDWSKVISRPTTMAGYDITDRPTLLNVRVFTTANSGQVYVPTPGTTRIYVEMVSGGGSGGRAVGNGVSSSIICASGGSAGTWACGVFTSGITGHTITVGAGGVCLSSGGVAGGTTSLGSLLSCPGGDGGLDGIAQTYSSGSVIAAPVPRPTSYSGVPTGTPLLYVRGMLGYPTSPYYRAGNGGCSPYGQGGVYSASRVGPPDTSAPSQNFGSAGAGASNSGGSTDTILGGSGAPGVIIVREYRT